MVLLIDIGNSRLKWATLHAGALSEMRAASYANWTRRDVNEQVLGPAGCVEQVLVSNVGGRRIAALVNEAVREPWGIAARFVIPTSWAAGVRNGYADPGQLGADRWAALLGAQAMGVGAACIISVGTAMTIDGLDDSGQHLGGLILPGPDLMVASLLGHTSDLAERSRGGATGSTLFADNTRGAIQQGTCHALAALVERAIDAMGAASGTTPAVLLTGGACARIEPYLARPARTVPDLVLRGLAVLAEQPTSLDA